MRNQLPQSGAFKEYDNNHDAMMLLWEAWHKAPHGRIRRLIVSAIGHLRESAFREISYGAVTPNKGWDGKRV